MYGFEKYKKGYLKGSDEKYYPVSDEVWTEYMRSWWREKSQEKRDRKTVTGKMEIGLSEGKSFPKVVSYDSITNSNGDYFLLQQRPVEDEVIRNVVHTCLRKAMEKLSPEEYILLKKIYFEDGGMSMREYAAKYNEPRTSVQYRHKKTLTKLRMIIENDKEFSREMLNDVFEFGER